jgi:hypothetical protein
MSDFKRTGMTRWRIGIGVAALAVLLVARGRNDHHDSPPAWAPHPPAAARDPFVADVQARVANMLDYDEPVAIDSVAVATPENTEPAPVN